MNCLSTKEGSSWCSRPCLRMQTHRKREKTAIRLGVVSRNGDTYQVRRAWLSRRTDGNLSSVDSTSKKFSISLSCWSLSSIRDLIPGARRSHALSLLVRFNQSLTYSLVFQHLPYRRSVHASKPHVSTQSHFDLRANTSYQCPAFDLRTCILRGGVR